MHYCLCIQPLQVQLEELTQETQWAQKQLESKKEDSRNAYQKCQELEAENKQLSEKLRKLSGFNNTNIELYNVSKAQVRKLEKEKEYLQNEVQIAKTEVCMNGCFTYVSHM